MSTRTRWSMVVATLILALLGATGCGGDSKPYIYVKQWRIADFDVTAGTTTPPLSVELNVPAPEKLWVDIENTYSEFVKVDPVDFLTFKVDEQKHDFTLKGLKAAPMKVAVKFTVRLASGPTSESRDLEFRVVDSIAGDFGPAPDRGPRPDTARTPDKSTTPDSGPKPDK